MKGLHFEVSFYMWNRVGKMIGFPECFINDVAEFTLEIFHAL